MLYCSLIPGGNEKSESAALKVAGIHYQRGFSLSGGGFNKGFDTLKDLLIKQNLLFSLHLGVCAVMCANPCTFLLIGARFRLGGARTHARTLHSNLLSCDACLVVQLALSGRDRDRDRDGRGSETRMRE